MIRQSLVVTILVAMSVTIAYNYSMKRTSHQKNEKHYPQTRKYITLLACNVQFTSTHSLSLRELYNIGKFTNSPTSGKLRAKVIPPLRISLSCSKFRNIIRIFAVFCIQKYLHPT
uniref:Uncharacterized protein n=1 Tax=Cacopsylla melanoneura TaxID=428564 RepID=A0A8D9BZ93_9HEMI